MGAPTTLKWLNAWTLRRDDARLLLMATWRTGEGVVQRVGDQLAPGLLSEWRRRPAVTLLPLIELEPTAVADYLMARFADAGLASRLAVHVERGYHPPQVSRSDRLAH
jgi:hypothetical protein